jgi:cell division protein FtsW (lipid II flippase)
VTQLAGIAVGDRRQLARLADCWSILLEALAVLAVVLALQPLFARVAEMGTGRGERFAAADLRTDSLPARILPDVCETFAAQAQVALAEHLCAPVGAAAVSTSDQFPLALTRVAEQAIRTLAAPAAVPLSCALAWAQAVWAEPEPAHPESATSMRGSARANAALLLAASIDGHVMTPALVATALGPSAARSLPSCPFDAAHSLAAAASSMGDAHRSASNARKNEAMRALLRGAGWQWAGAVGIGYALLLWSRRARSPALGIATALALWAGAAWLARVAWPLAPRHELQPARLEPSIENALNVPPADFVIWQLGCAAVMLLVAVGLGRQHAAPRITAVPSSRIGYAGLALATGLGWLLLLDLSANGNPANRYLALYHQGHLWLALLVFSVALFLRRALARGVAWILVVAGEGGRSVVRRWGRSLTFAVVMVFAVAGIVAFGMLLSNLRQLTSELGRVWLIGGAAWFFFLRGEPLADRLARSGTVGASLLRYAWPMIFVVGVLLGAMIVTRDMGPLLVTAYAAGAFVAASLTMWVHLRFARKPRAGGLAHLMAVALFAGWIVMVTLALFRFGEIHSVTATRLESLAAPFTSANDQLALVTWFQRATPPGGYGIGATPWCGYAEPGQCSGVPAQIHSDYTFTAIVGVFGSAAAWTVVLGCALWLHRLIRHHGRVTRGEPRLVGGAGWLANDAQALLSWVGVTWVVLTLAQLGVTVAGNLAVLPLTGVTFPIVSFGMTSLIVNLAFLALCLSVDRHDHA